jgi:hypothetical protein
MLRGEGRVPWSKPARTGNAWRDILPDHALQGVASGIGEINPIEERGSKPLLQSQPKPENA